jgi:MFS transporter, DHA1 family, tetracycline resistance protein
MNRDTWLVAAALLLWGVGEGLFYHIQSLYIEQLGADPVQLGTLLSLASVVSAMSLLPAGVLADRLPRKWVMFGGWALGFLGTLFIGLARTWQSLIPGLLLYSFSAYCVPVINAYLAYAVDGRNLEYTFTTVFAGYAAGGVISPAIGGWLADATSMRTVYFVSAFLFAISSLIVMQTSAQPAPSQKPRKLRWRRLLNRRFLGFAALVWLGFAAMYTGFPLAPNFLAEVGGWETSRIGILGSFQALGTVGLNPLLGRLNEGERGERRLGMMIGQALVWVSALLLVMMGSFPVLAGAYLLRGAYQSCRALTQARATRMGDASERGLMLGATETTIAAAQVSAPYVAGWLYKADPSYPFVASLVLIPIVLLLGGLRNGRRR